MAPATSNPELSPADDALRQLLTFFSQHDPFAKKTDPQLRVVQDACTELISRDYVIGLVENTHGELCPSYPLDIVVMESEKHRDGSEGPRINDGRSLAVRFRNARFSRVRARFVVPVILVGGRNICRSGTLSQEAEVTLNIAQDKFRSFMSWRPREGPAKTLAGGGALSVGGGSRDVNVEGSDGSDGDVSGDSGGGDDAANTSLMARQRSADIQLLKGLCVRYICDLMVENKKVKYGLNVCSSEKVDSQGRYMKAFSVVSIPFPGVEFFHDYKHYKDSASQLRFDWTQPFVNATLSIPDEAAQLSASGWEETPCTAACAHAPSTQHHTASAETANGSVETSGSASPTAISTKHNTDGSEDDVRWTDYRAWDVTVLTRNYLHLLLGMAMGGDDTRPDTGADSSAKACQENGQSAASEEDEEGRSGGDGDDISAAVNNAMKNGILDDAAGTIGGAGGSSSDSGDNADAKQESGRGTRSRASDGLDGTLVHCISGWDRTPLFISLLRLSLWADGVVHASLSADEILYLTLGYDWMLFGHLLKDRYQRGEDILFFCFDFLRFIAGDSFSMSSRYASTQSGVPSDSSRTSSSNNSNSNNNNNNNNNNNKSIRSNNKNGTTTTNSNNDVCMRSSAEQPRRDSRETIAPPLYNAFDAEFDDAASIVPMVTDGISYDAQAALLDIEHEDDDNTAEIRRRLSSPPEARQLLANVTGVTSRDDPFARDDVMPVVVPVTSGLSRVLALSPSPLPLLLDEALSTTTTTAAAAAAATTTAIANVAATTALSTTATSTATATTTTTTETSQSCHLGATTRGHLTDAMDVPAVVSASGAVLGTSVARSASMPMPINGMRRDSRGAPLGSFVGSLGFSTSLTDGFDVESLEEYSKDSAIGGGRRNSSGHTRRSPRKKADESLSDGDDVESAVLQRDVPPTVSGSWQFIATGMGNKTHSTASVASRAQEAANVPSCSSSFSASGVSGVYPDGTPTDTGLRVVDDSLGVEGSFVNNNNGGGGGGGERDFGDAVLQACVGSHDGLSLDNGDLDEIVARCGIHCTLLTDRARRLHAVRSRFVRAHDACFGPSKGFRVASGPTGVSASATPESGPASASSYFFTLFKF